ncbi:toll-like receptor 6 [Harmonia axyridis]|uniref:toll-like receptor 6 n=1 Tax=Harmonia axyridis TaxID=115357 RepID=UPI001E276BF8|nr:toll-like receptor 6 [Harmonia axyridis]
MCSFRIFTMFQLVLSVYLVGVVYSRALTSIESTPRGCEWLMEPVGDDGNEEPVLVCQIRTIGNAESVLGNLSQSQSDHVTVLKLECSDVLFFESSLEPSKYGNFLSNFRKLKDLKFEYCKIRNIPANALSTMRHLIRLSVRSHNSDWSAMSLDLHRESFRGMKELRSLDLSDNNIWNTPDEVFCPLFSLVRLNLSHNKLQDVATLGFSDWGNGPLDPGKACAENLEVLDLSHNDIIVLPENGLIGLKMLQTLYLQDNVISTLLDRAFAGLISLTTLNMSSNSLVELPPELFRSSRLLTHLYLHNNSLRVLAPGLLEGLDQLQILDLSINDLSSNSVNRDTFTGLVRLVVLNLSNNRLTKIDANLFHDLYTLQILNLEHNSIENVAEYAFSELKNLHTLTLSNNRISYIEPFHFAGVYAMNQLFIDSNRIKIIHPQAFENLTNLQDLGLNGNLLGAVPEGIGKLRFLRTLDLGKNRIDTVVNSSFEGLDILYGLRLVDNQIVNISRDAFSSLPSLSVLNLASNRIRYVEQSAFASNPTLKAIRLDDNELTDIKGVFTNLQTLMWLNVSSNNLAIFDYSHLPVSLEWLDMHDNDISELSNYYDVRNILKIKMLDVSFNSIVEIKQNSVPESVETLFLNNNKIRSVEPGTFMRNERLEKVVLYGNELENLELSALSLGPISDDIDVPQFYIGGNPFKCDCKMDWLLRINHLSNSRNYPQVLDLDAVMCELALARGGPPVPLLDLKPSQFLCPYETHCYTVCHCCEFDACDCEMTCPQNCTCYHDETWSSNVVDCHNAGYTEVPQNIPMDATEIYLDGNDLGELGNHVFIGKKKLEVLFLNGSNVRSVHNQTFNGVGSLKVLHMENNNIKELRGLEFQPLTKLSELYLDHNEIASVDNKTFQTMHRLEVLKLDENKIVDFSPWILPQVADSGLRPRVSLGGNKWSCDCSSLAPLLAWLRESGANPSGMICAESGDSRSVADVVTACENTANAAATSVVQEVVKNNQLLGGGYVPLLAATLTAILLVCLLSAVIFVFRQDVRLWIHSKYGVRIFQDPATVHDNIEDTDRLYDCYMIYSHKDEELAGRIIASELEHLGHTLCLHYRDLHLMGGASYLADAMVSAADASRRVILIVSPALICNEWAKPEFRAALQGALHATRHKLICVLSDDPLEPMDPELRALLRACTVTRWGERRFWDKLRYAIPDVINNRLPKRSKKPPEIRCKPNARYTPTPTALDSWYKYSAMPGVHHAPNLTPTPTQSTYVSGESARSTEDEAGSSTSSQHYGSDQMNHSYVSIDGRPPQYNQFPGRTDVPQHVYSTIPETTPHSRTYFV